MPFAFFLEGLLNLFLLYELFFGDDAPLFFPGRDELFRPWNDCFCIK